MKYIIELEKIPNTDLYRAKGANTLVFDENGIKNILTPFEEEWESVTYDKMLVNDVIKCEKGKALYEFRGLSKNTERINAVNLESGQFVCLPSDGNYVRRVEETVF